MDAKAKQADEPEEEDVVPYPRSEKIFLALAGAFLASMVCMNVLGITRFIQFWGAGVTVFGERITLFQLAIGVLPYPVTFLCTDIISELYGKKRARYVVWVGFWLNVFLIAVCWLGQVFPAPFEATAVQDLYVHSWRVLGGTGEPDPAALATLSGAYYDRGVYSLMVGATMASMVAYLAAQMCDVHLFHFWKRLTKGKHLWLRNNASTLVSQMLDTVCVLTITFWTPLVQEGKVVWLLGIIFGSYAFKVLAALLDTPLAYLAVHYLRPHVHPPAEDGILVPAPAPA